MRVVEIPKNSYPYPECKIFPDFLIRDGFIRNSIEGNRGYEYHLLIESLIPLEKNDKNYLIPFKKRVSKLVEEREIPEEFYLAIEESEKECKKLQEYYMVDENNELENPSNPIIIYKYKN